MLRRVPGISNGLQLFKIPYKRQCKVLKNNSWQHWDECIQSMKSFTWSCYLHENRKGLAPNPHCLMPSPWKSPYCISPMNLSSSWPEALTSRAPVWQRKVALIHKGVPRAVTTPRAHKKLNTPAVQKMTFFCRFGMIKIGFREDEVQKQDLCECREAPAPLIAFIVDPEETDLSWKGYFTIDGSPSQVRCQVNVRMKASSSYLRGLSAFCFYFSLIWNLWTKNL